MRSFGEVGVDWIDRTQDMGKWRTFVNAVMNNRAIKIRGISSVAEELSVFQGGLCFMQLCI
jgi:hypothetical protein